MSQSRAEVREFFHDRVDLGTSPGADYVVAHAARQRQRGKNPSVNYRNYTNPRESLAVAQADIDARNSEDDNTAVFSGRIALIRVWSEQQKEIAQKYAELLMEDRNAVGVIIQDLNDHIVKLREAKELGAEEPLPVPTPLHHRVTDQGIVEVMLPL